MSGVVSLSDRSIFLGIILSNMDGHCCDIPNSVDVGCKNHEALRHINL
jgi:hypothetical protein